MELIGRGQPFEEALLLSKFTQLPCLWYRYKVEQRTAQNKWKTIDSGETNETFLLRDDSGACVVDPEQAEIITKHRDQWTKDNYRYTEWKLIKEDSLYVIGEFRTQSGAMEFNSREELNALLTEWKKDMPALHARFDLNKDNVLDMEEWLLARQAAIREVEGKMRSAQAQPDINIVSQPHDGKLFLISNLTPDKLSRRYQFWTWAHLAIFFGALSAFGWLLQTTAYRE